MIPSQRAGDGLGPAGLTASDVHLPPDGSLLPCFHTAVCRCDMRFTFGYPCEHAAFAIQHLGAFIRAYNDRCQGGMAIVFNVDLMSKILIGNKRWYSPAFSLERIARQCGHAVPQGGGGRRGGGGCGRRTFAPPQAGTRNGRRRGPGGCRGSCCGYSGAAFRRGNDPEAAGGRGRP